MNKKKLIFEAVLFVLITGLTIYYLISSGIFNSISDLKAMPWWGFLVILGSVAIYVLCDSFIIYRSMKSIRPKEKYITGVEMYAAGNLGSGVTPSKTGHFPLILYFLNKKKYNIEESLTIIASNQIVYSFTLPFLYGAFMIYAIVINASVNIGDFTMPLFLVCLIGVLTNILYAVFVILLMYNKKFQTLVMNLEAWFLKKIKKMKNEQEWREKKLFKMKVYKDTLINMKKNFISFIPSVLVYFVFMAFCYGIPYICYLVLSQTSFELKDYLYCFMLCQAMSYVTNITPTPGGMVAAEFTFLTVYKAFMGTFVNAALLLYRFSTYFMLIIVDFIFFAGFMLVSFLRDKKKAKEMETIEPSLEKMNGEQPDCRNV